VSITVVAAGSAAGDAAAAGRAPGSPAEASVSPATAMTSSDVFVLYMCIGLPLCAFPRDGSLCNRQRAASRGLKSQTMGLRTLSVPLAFLVAVTRFIL
jgi:hypothetical protein